MTSLLTPYLPLLATTFIVILGAMMTPVVLALTRPVHPTVERLARQAVWNACKTCLARGVRLAVAVGTASVALSLLLAVMVATPASAQVANPAPAGAITTKAIERMTGVLDKAAKHPVPVTAGLIARGYTAVKVYRLSKEVKGIKTDVVALQTAVHAVLLDVTAVIERVEKGEVLTVAEIAAVNARIDVHAVRIAAVEADIEVLKVRMDAAEREQRALDRRQNETARQLSEQQQRITLDSKTPYLYFDPTCGCRRDKRDRVDGRSGLLDVKTHQR